MSREIGDYLDIPAVRDQLGVDPAISGKFTGCSDTVSAGFMASSDGSLATYYYVAALLERGVRVLIYVGKDDWVCNHVGNELWTLALEWTGREAFTSDPLRPWLVDGKEAGLTRSAHGLTYATVLGAGHMVRDCSVEC